MAHWVVNMALLPSDYMNDGVKEREVMVADLRPRMKYLNITFKVLDQGELHEIIARRDRKKHYIVDMKVGDPTGTVILPVWDDLIDYFEVGKTYRLENGYTSVYQGFLRLNIGRYGRVSENGSPIEEVDKLNNMSAEKFAPRRVKFRNRRFDFKHSDYRRHAPKQEHW